MFVDKFLDSLCFCQKYVFVLPLVIVPGSIKRPRQSFKRPSYQLPSEIPRPLTQIPSIWILVPLSLIPFCRLTCCGIFPPTRPSDVALGVSEAFSQEPRLCRC